MSRRHVRIIAATLLAAGALLGGCSNEAEAPAADPIEGTWQTAGGAILTFEAGEWEVAFNAQDASPFDGGTYQVDGTTLTLTPGPMEGVVPSEGFSCEQGQAGVYEMTVSDDGSTVTLTAVDDDCGPRSSDLDGHDLTKVESQ